MAKIGGSLFSFLKVVLSPLSHVAYGGPICFDVTMPVFHALFFLDDEQRSQQVSTEARGYGGYGAFFGQPVRAFSIETKKQQFHSVSKRFQRFCTLYKRSPPNKNNWAFCTSLKKHSLKEKGLNGILANFQTSLG